MNYQIDQAGVELIASFEGFENGAYNDSEGFATCGYGHLLHRSPATAQDHRTYDGKGRAYFLNLLHSDIERVSMAPMRQYIHVPLNQNRVNALASLAFNWGGGILNPHASSPLYSTMGRLLNAKKYREAGDYFLELAHPPILMPRRRQEKALYDTPVKTKTVSMPWLNADERRWCQEYDRLLREHKNVDRRRALREAMHKRAVDIAYAARHDGGWEKQHRRQRWHSLIARSS